MKNNLFFKGCCGCREEIFFWVMPLVKMGGQLGTHRGWSREPELELPVPSLPLCSNIPPRCLMGPQILHSRVLCISTQAFAPQDKLGSCCQSWVCWLSLRFLHHPFAGQLVRL